MTRRGPLGALARGGLAGAAGTGTMDLLWFDRYTRGGGQTPFLEWEFSVGLNSWDAAPAPARVGKLVYERLFQRELPASRAALTSNVMHWSYGIGWASLYGLVALAAPWLARPSRRSGLLFGGLVWAVDYAVLPLLKVYKPIWEYDARTLWDDLSAHLVYGAATVAVFGALSPESRWRGGPRRRRT